MVLFKTTDLLSGENSSQCYAYIDHSLRRFRTRVISRVSHRGQLAPTLGWYYALFQAHFHKFTNRLYHLIHFWRTSNACELQAKFRHP